MSGSDWSWSPSSPSWSWAASRPGTIRPPSTSPSMCPRAQWPSSITTWRTTPSIRPCSRCWRRSRSSPSTPSSPSGTGRSTTSTGTAPGSCRRSCRPGPCTASRSPRASCRCWRPAPSRWRSMRWLRSCSACGRAWSRPCSGCSIHWCSGLGHLDGVDLPFALTTVLVAWALVRWLRGRDRRSLIWLGVACGAVASAQVTGLLVVAVAVGVVVAASVRAGKHSWARWRPAALVVLLTWLVVWVVYVILDPSVVAHSWYLLPHPYVEGIKYLSSNDTASSPGLPPRPSRGSGRTSGSGRRR